ncbi:MAG: hypothetical protein Q8S84_01005 [bacterium]|nr:hypothetical protein [bacterium]
MLRSSMINKSFVKQESHKNTIGFFHPNVSFNSFKLFFKSILFFSSEYKSITFTGILFHFKYSGFILLDLSSSTFSTLLFSVGK